MVVADDKPLEKAKPSNKQHKEEKQSKAEPVKHAPKQTEVEKKQPKEPSDEINIIVESSPKPAEKPRQQKVNIEVVDDQPAVVAKPVAAKPVESREPKKAELPVAAAIPEAIQSMYMPWMMVSSGQIPQAQMPMMYAYPGMMPPMQQGVVPPAGIPPYPMYYPYMAYPPMQAAPMAK